ncbi:glucose-1-phosphate adenylyltransferase [soil metagenome]
MQRVICLILGGGRGTRLYPLTKSRSKPAVPIAGKYRLIDIPISNCIYSGLNRMFVLTQFNSVSLHRHIANTYKFDPFGGGFVEVLAAQQTDQSEEWYQGTADAVRQNIPYFDQPSNDLVLILSGDQLYRMDYQDMIRQHMETKADVTIAALPVDEQEATACGIMQIEPDGRIKSFVEKPKTPESLARARTEPAWLEQRGIHAGDRSYLASMGIYIFHRPFLVDLLSRDDSDDFGKGIFPKTLADPNRRVQIYPFDDYWEDIGTVGAFHRANIDMTRVDAPFDFTANGKNIFTRARYMPCSKIAGATIKDSLISDGAFIGPGSVIENSVIGVRAQIGANVTVRNSYVMGADVYDGSRQRELNRREGRPSIGINDHSVIENAIIDKNVRVGQNVRIVNQAGVEEAEETRHCVIRDGIVVVTKFATVEDGTVI